MLHNHINKSIESNIKFNQSNPVLDFLSKQLQGRKNIKIGLVLNTHQKQEEELELWEGLGETTVVNFERVREELKWEELFPEWIDEEEKWARPRCGSVPMPRHEDYGEFDVVVARVPCRNGVQGEGTRDVLALQVNLVVANLVVKNGRKNINGDVYVVFMGSCGPMWEIFRCDDLLMKHEEEGDNQFWVYKPEFQRLKQKVLNMPVGTCQLAVADHHHHHLHQNKKKQEDDYGEFNYDFSKLVKSIIDQPKEAYVTLLHSTESYVCGAMALAQSLLQTNTTKDLLLLADQSITPKSLRALRLAGWTKIKHIERIRNPHAKPKAYNEWNYSKLRIWQLTEYHKVIFIDSDLIVLKNIDSFFAFPQLSAVGNDKVMFNSGIMLIEPSKCVFQMLMEKRHSLVSYNGGDQGFLNEAFTWWHRWPSRLNYLKVYQEHMGYLEREVPKSGVRSPYAIHYLGLKPWMCYKDYDCNWDMEDHHQFASDSAHWRWWEVYDRMPKRLQRSFCGLSMRMDARFKKWRRRAKVAGLGDGHWKIKVKDPRQYKLIIN